MLTTKAGHTSIKIWLIQQEPAEFRSIHGCSCSWEADQFISFSRMVLVENFHLISASSQLATALISVFWWRGSPSEYNDTAGRFLASMSNVWMGKLVHFFGAQPAGWTKRKNMESCMASLTHCTAPCSCIQVNNISSLIKICLHECPYQCTYSCLVIYPSIPSAIMYLLFWLLALLLLHRLLLHRPLSCQTSGLSSQSSFLYLWTWK